MGQISCLGKCYQLLPFLIPTPANPRASFNASADGSIHKSKVRASRTSCNSATDMASSYETRGTCMTAKCRHQEKQQWQIDNKKITTLRIWTCHPLLLQLPNSGLIVLPHLINNTLHQVFLSRDWWLCRPWSGYVKSAWNDSCVDKRKSKFGPVRHAK